MLGTIKQVSLRLKGQTGNFRQFVFEKAKEQDFFPFLEAIYVPLTFSF